MKNEETKLSDRLSLAASERGYTLFRNMVGAGWTGKWSQTDHGILIQHPRFIKYGLIEGSGDYVGWKPVTITQAMVGQTIPVFASVEIKTPTGKPSKEQKKWDENLRKAGAISIIARQESDL